jgi:hypothetical protein
MPAKISPTSPRGIMPRPTVHEHPILTKNTGTSRRPEHAGGEERTDHQRAEQEHEGFGQDEPQGAEGERAAAGAGGRHP